MNEKERLERLIQSAIDRFNADAETLEVVKRCLRRIVSKSICNRYIKCQMLHSIYYAESIDALIRLDKNYFVS